MPADDLPDEVLAIILKFVADFPAQGRTPPFPVAAGHVSQRWRAVALGSSASRIAQVPGPGPRCSYDASNRSYSTSALTWSPTAAVGTRLRGTPHTSLSKILTIIGPISNAGAGSLSAPHSSRWPNSANISPGRRASRLNSNQPISQRWTGATSSPRLPEVYHCDPPPPPVVPIDAPTIKFLAISFSEPFYTRHYFLPRSAGFEYLMNIFSFLNLEHFEILADSRVQASRTMQSQLQKNGRPCYVGFRRNGPAFIQAFSSGITTLELIYTTGKRHLLAAHPDTEGLWPALRSLTVETADVITNPPWLAVNTPPVSRRRLVPGPSIWWLGGPSPALIDGHPAHEFYLDELDMHATNFEHGAAPVWRRSRCSTGGDPAEWVDEYFRELDRGR
ncbi:hypothetical protein DFH09DRAFT_1269655 [Mycena vulgaris]|nr:hypothetical protein DFH09DRAFT_1269655 [Mycena vulgaris]